MRRSKKIHAYIAIASTTSLDSAPFSVYTLFEIPRLFQGYERSLAVKARKWDNELRVKGWAIRRIAVFPAHSTDIADCMIALPSSPLHALSVEGHRARGMYSSLRRFDAEENPKRAGQVHDKLFNVKH